MSTTTSQIKATRTTRTKKPTENGLQKIIGKKYNKVKLFLFNERLGDYRPALFTPKALENWIENMYQEEAEGNRPEGIKNIKCLRKIEDSRTGKGLLAFESFFLQERTEIEKKNTWQLTFSNNVGENATKSSMVDIDEIL